MPNNMYLILDFMLLEMLKVSVFVPNSVKNGASTVYNHNLPRLITITYLFYLFVC